MTHSAATTLFWGIVLLVLFLWYLGTVEKAKKKLIGTILTVVMSLFCFWAFNGENLFVGKPINIHLGIDMAGGSSFTVRLEPGIDEATKKPRPITKSDVDQAISVLEHRLNPLGNKDIQIAAVGDDFRINIQMPGVSPEEINDVRTKITQIAHLEFRLVDPNNEADLSRVKAGSVPPIGYESMPYKEKEEDTEAPKGKQAKKTDEKDRPQIFVSQHVELDGSHVSRAGAMLDPQKGWVINLEFDSEGATLFDNAADKGYRMQSQAGLQAPPRLAIVVDNEVISAPNLQTRQFNGRAEISGSFTQQSASSLATALKNPLRNPMQIMEETTVSPAYGESVIKQGLYTGIVGTVIVALFMAAYYRFAGMIALVGLFVDFLIMFGTMSLFGFTLTMPGVAGMVLTIGMAVDANVLIYERMREELKTGKSLVAALDTAFEKAFPAIFDAHVTALITSVILFYLASGLVKGFAVTMLVGIVGTLFGALIVTRVVFHWFTDSGKLTTLKVHHLIPDRIYDMLSYSKPFIIGSFTLAALSVGVFAVKGKNSIGIDFRGGSITRFELLPGQNLSDGEVTAALKGLTMKVQEADGKQKEEPIGEYFIQHSQTTTGKLVTVRSEYEAGVPVKNALDAKFKERMKGSETMRVGSLVGSELARNSALAYVLAMLTIFIYLVARYETAFAIGAIVALFHDCLIVVGMSVAFGQELSLVHIGAVLTVAGYSINDTIIVFDRIREMIQTKSGRIRDIMNEAISITLSRTLLTSLTAFMPMAALFIFGGPAMRDFSLPILIGIIVGTYSSIYIAAPIVLWWAKRTGQSLRRQVLDSAAASEAAKQVKPMGA